MFQCHEQDPSDLPGQRDLTRLDIIVELQQSLTNPGLEIKDSRELRPITLFCGYFRMGLEYHVSD